MGESKRPIYAYVDESGNTGHNLFDDKQPDFFHCALVTRGDFDIFQRDSMRKIADKLGVDAFHGKDLGIGRIESVSRDILGVLARSRSNFFISRVEKKYLLAMKVFDALFDSGENPAVPWHVYNLKQLRHVLAFKLAHILDEETAKAFWKCLLEPREDKARNGLPAVCDGILANVDLLPDARSREILTQGLEWAREHPESIQIWVDKKLSRQLHFPNLVAFGNLLAGLTNYSEMWKVPVARISHDDQGEFKKTMTAWHMLFTNASPDIIDWAGEKYKLQQVPGSHFEVIEDSLSPGIQIADVIGWLYNQLHKGKKLSPGCQDLVIYALGHGWENDFSFSGVGREVEARYHEMMAQPFPVEKEMAARKGLDFLEKQRVASLKQYEVDKLPPFMRSLRAELPDD
jgi:hypothetical protein